ncbi:hypothetical protein [Flavobacterium sp.]|uniref:hypothetical protein n=1 Tax=Flavobacterium sp. TaxID=239 RepID=UPI002614C96D|nr:hypothetical protein [Flavobacterium sp.]
MESKSKKNISIFMIIGGLLVLGNYSLKLINEEKHSNNNSILVGCASVIIAIGVFSLIKTTNKSKI